LSRLPPLDIDGKLDVLAAAYAMYRGTKMESEEGEIGGLARRNRVVQRGPEVVNAWVLRDEGG
jgi:hypothetical protein